MAYGFAGVVEDVLATYPVGAVILVDGQYKEKQSDGTWAVLGHATTSSGMTTVGPTRQVETAAGTLTVSDLSFEQAQAKVLADAKAAAAAAAAKAAADAAARPALSVTGGTQPTTSGMPWLLLLGGAAVLFLMGRR